MSNAIEIQGLTKTFGRTVALDELDLQVPTGQIHGFLSMIGSVDQARIAFHQACGVLRLAFAGGLRQPI